MHVAVIGAGPAGLSAAYWLSKNNISTDLYDVSPRVGGLAKTIRLMDEEMEMGSHFLRVEFFNQMIDLVPELKTIEFCSLERSSVILLNDKAFSYPPQIQEIIANFSILELAKFGFSLIKSKAILKSEQNSKSFLINQLGNSFYKSFFEPYLLKIWGVNGNDLHTVFARSLIGNNNISVLSKIKMKFIGDKKSNAEIYSKIIYPLSGFSAIWDCMACAFEKNRGKLLLSTKISSIYPVENKLAINSSYGNGGDTLYDHVIATLPPAILGNLFNSSEIPPLNYNDLTYRTLIIVYIKLEGILKIKHQCIYLYDSKISIARITCYNNFSEKNTGIQFVGIEYWVDKDDPMSKMQNDEIVNSAYQEIKKIAWFTDMILLMGDVVKINNAYLVPNIKMPDLMDEFRRNFDTIPNLTLTGRSQGKNFNYSIEDAFTDGLNAAKSIVNM